MIKEEQKDIEKYSFLNLFFCDELDNRIVSYENFYENENLLISIPLEYFEITKNKDKNLIFNYFHLIYKKCIKNRIRFEVKNGALNKLLKDKEFPRTFFGSCLEKKITLLLMNNKLNIENLYFEEKNIKGIYQISDLKKFPYDGPKLEVKNKENPILLIQENYFGPNYTLLIIMKYKNKYYANFVQIGVDKSKEKIENILDDLIENKNNYKKNIQNLFEIDSDDIIITLFFIFDLETQKEKNYLNGVKICNEKKINFFLFSNDDEYLFKYDNHSNNLSKMVYFIPDYLNINEDQKKLKRNNINKSNEKFHKISEYFH